MPPPATAETPSGQVYLIHFCIDSEADKLKLHLALVSLAWQQKGQRLGLQFNFTMLT